MGQRNPAPVENGGKHPTISHYLVGVSTIRLVMQDFAGSSTVSNFEFFVMVDGQKSPSYSHQYII